MIWLNANDCPLSKLRTIMQIYYVHVLCFNSSSCATYNTLHVHIIFPHMLPWVALYKRVFVFVSGNVPNAILRLYCVHFIVTCIILHYLSEVDLAPHTMFAMYYVCVRNDIGTYLLLPRV